jgi:hypothetical protein
VPRQFFEGAKKPMAAFLAWTHLVSGCAAPGSHRG